MAWALCSTAFFVLFICCTSHLYFVLAKQRSDSGRAVFNSSYLLGDMTAGALSNLYYPNANRGANLVFTNAALGLAGRVGTNLMREFLSKRLTTNVSGDGNQ